MRRLAVLILLVASLASGQPRAARAAREWRQAHETAILAEFVDLLKIPNVASDRDNIHRNAAALRAMLEKRGVRTALWETEGAPPVVFGSLETPGAAAAVVMYAHYDGQPADPKEWAGHGPWDPVLRSGPLEDGGRVLLFPVAGGAYDPEWRLYGRSTSDDKAPILAALAALDALRAAGQRRAVNLRFVFEGEEERGSASLGRILEAHKDEVKADYWLICDGPVHQSRRQQIYFGARGIISLDLTVYGPRRELHSGHYGNWAPNPALMLAQLLASMKDDAGHVRIAGFYDSSAPLGAEERAAMAAEPAPDEALKRELWLGRTENPPRKLIEAINEPSLNIRGLRSAATGAEARNVIPADATASIDVRLVKGNDPRAMFALVRAHIERRGYFVVDRDPTAEQRLSHAKVAKLVLTDPGYRAVRTPMNSPAARSVMQAVESLHPDVVKMPTLGGSVPLALIEDVVQVPLIGVPIANHDNRQHSANENLRLKNLWDGIELFAVLFTAEP